MERRLFVGPGLCVLATEDGRMARGLVARGAVFCREMEWVLECELGLVLNWQWQGGCVLGLLGNE